MAPVHSDSFNSKEGEGEGGIDLRRVQRGLVFQVSAAGRLSVFIGVPIAADYMPSQCCWGWGKSTGFSLGVCVIKRIAPYLSLNRRF